MKSSLLHHLCMLEYVISTTAPTEPLLEGWRFVARSKRTVAVAVLLGQHLGLFTLICLISGFSRDASCIVFDPMYQCLRTLVCVFCSERIHDEHLQRDPMSGNSIYLSRPGCCFCLRDRRSSSSQQKSASYSIQPRVVLSSRACLT